MALQHPPAPLPQPSAHGFLPTLATGLTDKDRRRIEDALDRSVSANTRAMYASAKRTLQRPGSRPAATSPCQRPPALVQWQVWPDVTYLYSAGSRVEDEVNPHTAEFSVPFE